MPDMIETTIAEMEKQLAALKEVASRHPGCYCRTHGDYISVWVVDIPHEECDRFHIQNHSVERTASGHVHWNNNDGFVIIYKNIGPGVNIAPQRHRIALSLFQMYMQEAPKTMQTLAKLFEEKAP